MLLIFTCLGGCHFMYGRVCQLLSSPCKCYIQSVKTLTFHSELWEEISKLAVLLPLSPPGWRGIVVTVRAGGRAGGRTGGRAGGRAGGWAGGCQTCGTHISVTAWWIFSVRSSMELSRPVVVHCHAHTPICPIWACPWAKNLSNLPQIGSRLCGSHISETAGWIYPI